jgi:uncharacterized small protein (DUF1192 family)
MRDQDCGPDALEAAMDLDEFAPKKAPMAPLGQEDLSRFSIEDLDERVALLQAEIQRCEATKAAKQATRDSANRFFKS